MVKSGIKGWKNQMERRAQSEQCFYRGATSTLKQRIRKKLLDPVNWYKNKTQDTDDKKKQDEKEQKDPSTIRRRKRKAAEDEEAPENCKKQKQEEDPKSVLFCPYTRGSELARLIRGARTTAQATTAQVDNCPGKTTAQVGQLPRQDNCPGRHLPQGDNCPSVTTAQV